MLACIWLHSPSNALSKTFKTRSVQRSFHLFPLDIVQNSSFNKGLHFAKGQSQADHSAGSKLFSTFICSEKFDFAVHSLSADTCAHLALFIFFFTFSL